MSFKTPGAIRGHRRLDLLVGMVLTVGVVGGCAVGDLATADRMKNGLVIVLPGIEGRSKYNADIARGLSRGGVPFAIEIYDWGTGLPLGSLVNLVALDRNRGQARKIADRIVRYQQDYPGRSIHLVGHSGGGGLAVLTLEALPPGVQVSSAVLLAAAMSPDHDLNQALNHTENGIWNFHTSSDVGYLQVGTGLFGTIDRKHTRAAGAVGFRRPAGASTTRARAYDKLHPVRYRPEMAQAGNRGGHTGWARRQFVAVWVAPILLAAGDGREGYHIPLDDRLEGLVGRGPPEPKAAIGALVPRDPVDSR